MYFQSGRSILSVAVVYFETMVSKGTIFTVEIPFYVQKKGIAKKQPPLKEKSG